MVWGNRKQKTQVKVVTPDQVTNFAPKKQQQVQGPQQLREEVIQPVQQVQPIQPVQPVQQVPPKINSGIIVPDQEPEQAEPNQGLGQEPEQVETPKTIHEVEPQAPREQMVNPQPIEEPIVESLVGQIRVHPTSLVYTVVDENNNEIQCADPATAKILSLLLELKDSQLGV